MDFENETHFFPPKYNVVVDELFSFLLQHSKTIHGPDV